MFQKRTIPTKPRIKFSSTHSFCIWSINMVRVFYVYTGYMAYNTFVIRTLYPWENVNGCPSRRIPYIMKGNASTRQNVYELNDTLFNRSESELSEFICAHLYTLYTYAKGSSYFFIASSGGILMRAKWPNSTCVFDRRNVANWLNSAVIMGVFFYGTFVIFFGNWIFFFNMTFPRYINSACLRNL